MRNEKGSVTLFVLVSMLFFLIIATTAYVSASSKLQGQNEEIAQIKASYEQDLSDEALLQLYNRVTKTREWLPGSGTQEDTYKIYTIEDLVELSNRTNGGEDFTSKYVELMNDLDFKRDSSYANASRTDFGDINEDGTTQDIKTELTTGQGFMPIGKTNALSFKGTFEGNNYTINHLYIDRNTNFIALFGNSYTVQNLTVKNGYVKGCSATGGIVGALRIGKVENCHNDNTTVILREGDYYVVGGVVGQASTGSEGVFNCSNSGNISAYGTYLYSGVNLQACGGVIGKLGNSNNVFNCSNKGTVTGYNGGLKVGGVIGENGQNNTISQCSNSGPVTGSENLVGGICGAANGTIEKSYNTGTVIQKGGAEGLGGICGEIIINGIAKVLNCYNTGKLIEESSNTNGIGGIVGYLAKTGTSGEIKNNYSVGEIEIRGTNVTNVGGVIGKTASTFTIDNNYYLTGNSNVTLNSIGVEKPQTDMKTQAFVDLLNSAQSEFPWQLDTGINNGYPILKWQVQN